MLRATPPLALLLMMVNHAPRLLLVVEQELLSVSRLTPALLVIRLLEESIFVIRICVIVIQTLILIIAIM